MANGIRAFDNIPKRTASGRLSRSGEAIEVNEQEAMKTALEARQRRHGLTEKEAKDPMFGFVFGRKYRAGHLGDGAALANQRFNAGSSYAAELVQCREILHYPPISAQAMDFGRVRGIPAESMDQAAQERIAKLWMKGFDSALFKIGIKPNMALRQCVLEDQAATEFWPQTKNDLLCKALDAIVVEYGREGRAA